MNNTFSIRLKNARTLNGLSMDQLAEKSGLSKNAISRYEKGDMKPDSTNLIRLANALNLKIDYFFRPISVELNNVEFRKKAKLGKKKTEAIKQKVIDHIERYMELESLVNSANHLTNPLTDILVNDYEDVEKAANQLRLKWDLGSNPIASIIEVLEDHQVKVVEVDAPQEFDGLASLIDDKIPVIVVNKNFPVERKRFTLLHELGHLVMNLPDELSDKLNEKYCHRFAGAFLIPKQEFIKELGTKRTKPFLENELVSIQKEWGISIRAIMARANDLNVITDNKYKSFYIKLNSNAAFKNNIDLTRFDMKEESLRFSQLLYRAISQELISISKASTLSNISVNDLRNSLKYI